MELPIVDGVEDGKDFHVPCQIVLTVFLYPAENPLHCGTVFLSPVVSMYLLENAENNLEETSRFLNVVAFRVSESIPLEKMRSNADRSLYYHKISIPYRFYCVMKGEFPDVSLLILESFSGESSIVMFTLIVYHFGLI